MDCGREMMREVWYMWTFKLQPIIVLAHNANDVQDTKIFAVKSVEPFRCVLVIKYHVMKTDGGPRIFNFGTRWR